MKPNKFAGRCSCGAFVTPNAGTVDRVHGRWAVFCATCRVPDFAHASTPKAESATQGGGEDYPCSDMGYEDSCAAACGIGL